MRPTFSTVPDPPFFRTAPVFGAFAPFPVRFTMHDPTHRSTSRFSLAAALLLPALSAQAVTLAYYRFEGASLGEIVGPVDDLSGAGRSVHPWGPVLRTSDVPAASVPATGASNFASVRFLGDSDCFSNADEGLSRQSPASFTIEAWVKFDSLAGVQTFIGRDDINEAAGRGSLFYFSKESDVFPAPDRTANAFRVELVTRDNAVIAVNSGHVAQQGVWYHVAAVGDATKGTLSLYVDGRPVGDCAGFTGLFSPSGHGMWTIGRGQFNGRVADRFSGSLDEVRFSDVALAPDRFLNVAPFVLPEPVPVSPPSSAPIIPDEISQAPAKDAPRETSASGNATKRPSRPKWPAKR